MEEIKNKIQEPKMTLILKNLMALEDKKIIVCEAGMAAGKTWAAFLYAVYLCHIKGGERVTVDIIVKDSRAIRNILIPILYKVLDIFGADWVSKGYFIGNRVEYCFGDNKIRIFPFDRYPGYMECDSQGKRNIVSIVDDAELAERDLIDRVHCFSNKIIFMCGDNDCPAWITGHKERPYSASFTSTYEDNPFLEDYHKQHLYNHFLKVKQVI